MVWSVFQNNNISCRRERSCCPGGHLLRLTIIASVVVVDSSQSHHGLPRRRWPSEGMSCTLDGILHFKSNPPSTPWIYPGFNSYLDRNFIPIPETSVCSESAREIPGVLVQPSYTNPGTSVSSVRLCHNTRNFWKFRKTFIPVPGTCGYSVRLSYLYLEFL